MNCMEIIAFTEADLFEKLWDGRFTMSPGDVGMVRQNMVRFLEEHGQVLRPDPETD